MATKILLAGGYGQAGQMIAGYLLRERAEVELTISGRNKEKAQETASQLQKAHPQSSISALALDLSDREALKTALKGRQLFIAASSTISHTGIVAEACLDAGVDYYDIQLSAPQKLEALRKLRPSIESEGRCFITDGGFHPGILAALGRYAALQFDELHQANIYVALRVDWNKMAVTPGTRDEFVEEFKTYSSKIFQGGQWITPSFWKTYPYDFGQPIGRISCAPMYFEEMTILPKATPGLQETGVFISGFNPVTDYLVLPLLLAGFRFLPERWQSALVSLFWWSLRFCRPPFLARLVLDAAGLRQGASYTFQVQLSHPDGYVLTAIPVVAALLQYLDGSARKPGLWFQGEVVEPERFFRDVKRMGVSMKRIYEASGPQIIQ
ncbi:MAG: saccharopine dehydrogenase NADP-binding domain-containing protein [Phaeodactylibacter sp.]|nr:saccharopine dehydrogenase NADP-binding domain-containing protein [Phaeodactylibacter sp.]MCB9299085.1 saccharopine dehydrogenase NADP-binding domain-containing protein [Lewinellaceae bacterium]